MNKKQTNNNDNNSNNRVKVTTLKVQTKNNIPSRSKSSVKSFKSNQKENINISSNLKNKENHNIKLRTNTRNPTPSIKSSVKGSIYTPIPNKRKFSKLEGADLLAENAYIKNKINEIYDKYIACNLNKSNEWKEEFTFEIKQENNIDITSELLPRSLNTKGSLLFGFTKFWILLIDYKYPELQLCEIIEIFNNAFLYEQNDYQLLYDYFIKVIYENFDNGEIYHSLAKSAHSLYLPKRKDDIDFKHYKYLLDKPEILRAHRIKSHNITPLSSKTKLIMDNMLHNKKEEIFNFINIDSVLKASNKEKAVKDYVNMLNNISGNKEEINNIIGNGRVDFNNLICSSNDSNETELQLHVNLEVDIHISGSLCKYEQLFYDSLIERNNNKLDVESNAICVNIQQVYNTQFNNNTLSIDSIGFDIIRVEKVNVNNKDTNITLINSSNKQPIIHEHDDVNKELIINHEQQTRDEEEEEEEIIVIRERSYSDSKIGSNVKNIVISDDEQDTSIIIQISDDESEDKKKNKKKKDKKKKTNKTNKNKKK